MNKPITMIIKETTKKIVNVCNESGLPPVILDLVMQGVHSDIHLIAERQSLEEEFAYINATKEDAKNEHVENDNAK